MKVGGIVAAMTLGAACLGLTTVVDTESRPAIVIGAAVLIASAVLVREVARWSGSSSRVGTFVCDDRPPDGLVPVVAMAGVVADPNPRRGDCRVYRSLKDDRRSQGQPRSRTGPAGLRGRVAIVSVFVGRGGASWSDAEVVEAFEGLERAGLWIEREATRWGVPVNVELMDTYFSADDPTPDEIEIGTAHDPYETIIDEVDAGQTTLVSVSRAVRRLGFEGFADLIARVDPRVEADATLWLVHLRQAGASRAILDAPSFGLEARVALCFARHANVPGPLVGPPYVDPVTVVHEALHLFGATDKYGTSLRTFPDRSVTSRDVMRLDEERLPRLRVDPLTAREIGWGRPGTSGP